MGPINKRNPTGYSLATDDEWKNVGTDWERRARSLKIQLWRTTIRGTDQGTRNKSEAIPLVEIFLNVWIYSRWRHL